MSQYQEELKEVEKKGGNIEEFKKDWHKRACAAYRRNVKTEDDIHKFRCGDFTI